MKTILCLCALIISALTTTAQNPGPPGTTPFVLGVVDTLSSTILKEKRVLNIYLPEGYKLDDTTKYPVVYLLDGSADEDFIHVAGLYQFNSFSWIQQAPKSIVVGIANVNRQRDFTFASTDAAERKAYPASGHSARFIQFIKQELQPFIRRRYQASSASTIIGQSLGGLLATEILLKQPALFDRYIIISPSLWWSNAALLQVPVSRPGSSGARIYIGVGKEGLTPGNHPRVMEVDANLLAEKLKAAQSPSTHVYFDYLPQENHATIAHQAIFNALRVLHAKQEGK